MISKICIFMYNTCLCQYMSTYTSICKYMLSYPRIYAYIWEYTSIYIISNYLKKVCITAGFEPVISCILSAGVTTALRASTRRYYYFLSQGLYTLDCQLSSFPSPGGWCRTSGAGPAAPPAPAMTSPARASTWKSWSWPQRASDWHCGTGTQAALKRLTEARLRNICRQLLAS